MSGSATYKDAGVDIDAGNNLVDKIKPLVKSTNRTGADTNIGGFGGLFDLSKCGYKDPIMVAATDGVGTKLKIAQIAKKHDTIGIDLVAMCVNDLIVQGAEPLFFLDYFATGKLDVDEATEIIKGIADGCKQAGCALIGGETAEMPGIYKLGDYDLAGFSVGAVERDEILPTKNIAEGDVIIGLKSSGVHSNGFSLIRHIVEQNGISYQETPEGFKKNLAETLLEPTVIYVKECLGLIKKGGVKALAHITGGGLTENIPRILEDNVSVEIDLSSFKKPIIFDWIREKGNIETAEMLKTFNCGIGMVIIIDKNSTDKIDTDKYDIIGHVTAESGAKVIYKNLEKF